MRLDISNIQSKVLEVFDDIDSEKAKGWSLTDKPCPFCGKDNKHFGLRFNYDRSGDYKNHVAFNCFKCGEKGSEAKLFKKLNLEEYLDRTKYIKNPFRVNLENKIESFRAKRKSSLDTSVKTIRPPMGYSRVYSDEYLDSRGFKGWQYKQYNVGVSSMMQKLREYILIIIEEDGECKGYVGRHKWSKSKLAKHRANTGENIARYINETGVEFDKLLFGIDELKNDTHTVIVVEGIFDKFNVDSTLELNLDDSIKCVSTFGKTITPYQIEKLKAKSINNVFIMYDSDAVKECKVYSEKMSREFKNVKVCFIPVELNKDAGDLNYDEMISLIKGAQDPINFMTSKLQKINLRK